MSEKNSYQSKFISIKDAAETFDNVNDLILALQEGDIVAEGQYVDENSFVENDAQCSMTVKDGDIHSIQDPFIEIPKHHWVNYEPVIQENKLEWDLMNKKGDNDYGYYANVRVHQKYLDNVTVLLNIDKRFTSAIDSRQYEHIDFIGAAYFYLKSKKGNIKAKDVWFYLADNKNAFSRYISDYVEDHGDQWFVFLSPYGGLSDMHRGRFDTIISEFKKGKRKLPDDLAMIFHG